MPERAAALEFRGAIPVAPAQLAAIRLAELAKGMNDLQQEIDRLYARWSELEG